MFLAILLGSLIVVGSQRPPQEFSSAVEALSALDRMGECKCDTDVKAFRYFESHPDESIPVLIDFTLKNKHRHRVSIGALSRLKDERVITFLIKLAYDELLIRPDFFGHSEEIVSHLIRVFGNYGDKRAIPIIEESLGRLNNQHRDDDWEALCKLGRISISELFERHSESAAKIYAIASSNVYGNPKFSVEVFDWIIDHFPHSRALLVKCHSEKVMALYNRQEYSLALAECEFLKQDGGSTKGISFAVDRRGYSLDEMIVMLKSKVEIKR